MLEHRFLPLINDHLFRHPPPPNNAMLAFPQEKNSHYTTAYENRLKDLNLYSIQRRRDSYQIICVARLCLKKHVTLDRIGSIAHNSFRWRAIRLFNSVPKSVRNITDVDISVFRRLLDYYLRTLRDSPTEPFSDNSVNRRIEEAS